MKPESTEWVFAGCARRVRVLLALVGFACVLAGCGSGDDDSNDGGNPDNTAPVSLRCAP